MIRILIVEDELSISELIRINLKLAGYECMVANDGRVASEILEKEKFDLILLDVMLPYVDGFELMEYIKTLGTPVIFITAKASIEDRIKGLTSGAEDYIVKPFEVVELLARVNIVLRRYHMLENKLTFNDIVIDIDNQKVMKNNEIVPVTHIEFKLILLFFRNIGITLYREKIYEEVWGDEYSWDSRTLDLHIQRIRKKLDLRDNLKTVYKVGYRLEKVIAGNIYEI